MTDKQPEALRLANDLDKPKIGTVVSFKEVAALLRTQHAAIERKDALLRQAADAMYEAQTYTGSASRSPSMTKDLQALCLAITKELSQ